MSDVGPLLDKADIERALRRLGERLDRRGIVADLYVFGGAAMALAYDARRATRDIDALMIPHGGPRGSACSGCGTRVAALVAERAGQRLHLGAV